MLLSFIIVVEVQLSNFLGLLDFAGLHNGFTYLVEKFPCKNRSRITISSN